MLQRRWWHHRHTAAGGEGLAPCSATLLHVDPVLAAPALAAPAMAAPAMAAPAMAAPALAAPAMAAPALWAEEKVSAIVCRMMGRGGYLCIPLGSFTRCGGVESVR